MTAEGSTAAPQPCENFCDDGIVACWSPGGPCATTVCEFCGPCQLCILKGRANVDV